MNRNLFQISEEEKNRIRVLHESKIHNYGTSLIMEKKIKTKLPNWKGRNEGKIKFNDTTHPETNAVNVTEEKYFLATWAHEGRTGEVKGIVWEFPTYELKNTTFPYPDNLVFPKFENFPDAKASFDKFISNIVEYFKAGGDINKIPTFIIQGSADAARPTTDIPKGYTSLDHPDSTPYNGLTDPSEMNQYLADKRAEGLKKTIVDKVLEMTKKDLSDKIKTIKGINYYGQEGKRGFEFKKVSVTPSISTISLPPKPIDGLPEDYSTWRKIEIDGSVYMGWMNKDVGFRFCIPKQSVNSLSEQVLPTYYQNSLNNKTILNAKIVNNEIIVDGISYGSLVSPNDILGNKKDPFNAKLISTGRWVVVGERDNSYILQNLSFTLSYLAQGFN